jgi:hypothetical protein
VLKRLSIALSSIIFMKRIIFLFFLVPAVFISPAQAQVTVIANIGSQPLWGPVGYDRVEYYYLPDIETYYYVPQHQFIYLSNGKWVFSPALPANHAGYDLYSGYKVVINKPNAYLSFKEHKTKYAMFKNSHLQHTIITSQDPKYFVIKGHPKNASQKKIVSNGKGRKKK